MKKYIFMTYDIHPIGGTQMLVAGKSNYLEKHDWQVYVFFPGNSSGESEIPMLNKYISGCGFYELWNRPYRIPARDQKRVLDRMVEILMLDQTIKNDIIIESHYDVVAFWAELLAERIHARHFFSTCNEHYRDVNQFYRDNLPFFYFKYKRREILTSSLGCEFLFNGYRNIRNAPLNFPLSVNVYQEMSAVQEIDNPLVKEIVRQDLNIAYIGRTEKVYVVNIFKEVAKFSANHLDKKIHFVIVGKLKDTDLLKKLFENLFNVSITLTGNLIPIPRSLFKKLDVVIAGGQTATFCAYENVPVIFPNVDSNYTNGCIYYDLDRQHLGDQIYSYAEMLEKVLIKREYDNRTPILPERHPDSWHYEKILEIQLTQSSQTLEYCTEKFKKDLSRNWIAVFPFSLVEKNSRIILYGLNEITRDYQKQINNYCEVVAIVSDNYENFDRDILSPEKLTELDYDLIVIAELPVQKIINSMRENVFRITGKRNFVYQFNVFVHE